MKLWAGRFQEEVDSRVNDFNSSISFDAKMIEEDINGSIAHATMLGATSIIAKAEAEKIVAGLGEILEDLKSGKLLIDPTAEDVHTFVEGALTERLGETGKRLHTARSRNDQVALDVRLYLRQRVKTIQSLLVSLIDCLCDKAEAEKSSILPGYTHLQRAQPITFGHHLMAYAQMFLRDLGRLSDMADRMNELPLGSGALAGTTYPIDRQMTASLLGFLAPTVNSLDGVSDRDFCIEGASALSLIMMHLSRFCEEIILWCSWEFQFVELSDRFSTGSSIMPQKKNPDVAELIRGKTGRVYGDLTTLLVMMKGLPLAYNKDMQEDKEAIFDAFDTTELCISTFTPMIETMTIKRDKMRAAAAKGFINATDCADYLVKKGMAFRDAYKITGSLVHDCIEQKATLDTLPLAHYQQYSELFTEDLYHAIDFDICVSQRMSEGGPAPESVSRQVALTREKLKPYKQQ